MFGVSIALYLCTILFSGEKAGLLYGIVPEPICKLILMIAYAVAICLVISYLRVHWFLEKSTKEPERTVTAIVFSKEVKRGTQRTGRFNGTGFVKDNFHFENVGAVIDRPKHFGNNRRKRAINDRPYMVLSYIAQHHRLSRW